LVAAAAAQQQQAGHKQDVSASYPADHCTAHARQRWQGQLASYFEDSGMYLILYDRYHPIVQAERQASLLAAVS
jgi:hypothetical protein